MRRLVFSVLMLVAAMGTPALALSPPVRDHNPYWIMMRCDTDMPSCSRPRMAYQPGQSLASDPRGSYFYYTPKYERDCNGRHHRKVHHKARYHKAGHRTYRHKARHSRRGANPARYYYHCNCDHRHMWWPAN